MKSLFAGAIYGTFAFLLAMCAGFFVVFSTLYSVMVGPGLTALTRTPWSAQ